MSSLTTFLESPLARHPRLLLRKIAERVGLYREDRPIPQPTSSAISLPPHVKQRLDPWIASIPITPKIHSFSNLFGHQFEEAELMRLCSTGPISGRSDLTADIKLIWDFSRAHPLFLNLCVSRSEVENGAAFVRRWLKANENTNGPAWICAMDVAIRAVNWIAADAISDGALGREFGHKEWSEWIWRHGAAIWQRLECRTKPSNHYLADLVGLVAISAVFPQDPVARRWSQFAEEEFPQALLTQTRFDGGLNEASLRYHAFVTEMALVARIFATSEFPSAAEERIRQMCQVIADFRDAEGDTFPVGDDDSGRVLALDHATELGRADVLLKLAELLFGKTFSSRPTATCPESGWWIRRQGDWSAVMEFGGVGLRGHGSHAHSDDLSVCIEWRGQALIVDPGTYAYTWNPNARNRLRSLEAHNTLTVDHNDPLKPGPHLFYLPGPDDPLNSEITEDAASFQRRAADGILHRRIIRFPGGNHLLIEDEVAGPGTHELVWRFHLAPQWRLEVQGGNFFATSALGAVRIEVNCKGGALLVEAGEFSPGYGQVEPCAVAVVKTNSQLPVRCGFTFEAVSGPT